MKLINLLPKARQETLQSEAVLSSLYKVIWTSIFSFGLVIASQLLTKLYLQNQAGKISDSVAQMQNQVDKADNAKIKTRISEINNLVTDYNNLWSSAPKWYQVIKAFAALPPDQVVLNSFNIDFGKKFITITGSAPTRDLVIQLYNNILADDKEFYGVDYPFENVARQNNVSFHFNFFIRDSLLK